MASSEVGEAEGNGNGEKTSAWCQAKRPEKEQAGISEKVSKKKSKRGFKKTSKKKQRKDLKRNPRRLQIFCKRGEV